MRRLYLNEAKVCRRFGGKLFPLDVMVPGKFVERPVGVRYNMKGKLEPWPMQLAILARLHRLGKGLFGIECRDEDVERIEWYLIRQCG